jgi:hypothetical protein
MYGLRCMRYETPSQLPTDGVLAELIPEFLQSWMHDIRTEWPLIVASANKEDFRRFGHTIKGSFLQFGLPSLAQVGRDIMEDSETENYAVAQSRLDELVSILEHLHQQTLA